MKLRNKKTGEIIELPDGFLCCDNLKKICEEWEDVPEEPKEYWSYDTFENDVSFNSIANEDDRIADQEIGNYFNTREEAELAVRKLKAWKRLKDKGFRFEGWEMDGTIWFETKKDEQEWSPKYRDDLDLLFGGEE